MLTIVVLAILVDLLLWWLFRRGCIYNYISYNSCDNNYYSKVDIKKKIVLETVLKNNIVKSYKFKKKTIGLKMQLLRLRQSY